MNSSNSATRRKMSEIPMPTVKPTVSAADTVREIERRRVGSDEPVQKAEPESSPGPVAAKSEPTGKPSKTRGRDDSLRAVLAARPSTNRKRVTVTTALWPQTHRLMKNFLWERKIRGEEDFQLQNIFDEALQDYFVKHGLIEEDHDLSLPQAA